MKRVLQRANALGRYVLCALFQVWQHKYWMWVVSVCGSTSINSYINDRNVKQKLNSSHQCWQLPLPLGTKVSAICKSVSVDLCSGNGCGNYLGLASYSWSTRLKWMRAAESFLKNRSLIWSWRIFSPLLEIRSQDYGPFREAVWWRFSLMLVSCLPSYIARQLFRSERKERENSRLTLLNRVFLEKLIVALLPTPKEGPE